MGHLTFDICESSTGMPIAGRIYWGTHPIWEWGMKLFENQSSQGRNVIILLGGPGAGKGTQAEAIREWLKVPHISSGHLLRSEVAAATPLGLRVKAIVDAGGLVGDGIVNELVLERIRN